MTTCLTSNGRSQKQALRGRSVVPSRLSKRHCIFLLTLVVPAWGGSSEANTLEGDVVTVAGRMRGAASPLEIGDPTIEALRPRTLDQIVRSLPSISLAQNSRGESVAAVRGRGERETLVTLEGIPLNDPWDGRVNFAALPAGLIGAAQVAPEGDVAFASGSVVAFDLISDPPRLSGMAEKGTGDLASAQLTASLSSIVVDALHTERSGAPLSSASDAFDSQNGQRQRTNSDRVLSSLSAAARFARGPFQGGAFALSSASSYGVPPENHLDPEGDQIRYWRVPEDDRLLLGGYGALTQSAGTIRTRLWHQRTDRRIEIFPDASFLTPTSTEDASSKDTGAAISAEHSGGSSSVKAGGELRRLSHDQASPEDEKFARRKGAAWLSAEIDQNSTSLSGSFRFEGSESLQSGGRPEAPHFGLFTGRISAAYRPDTDWEVRLSAARLGRLPSLRELYGEQLGRFLINPDLKPESRNVASLSVSRLAGPFTFTATGFAERSNDGIGQRVVLIDDQLFRQRINQDGFSSLGLEVNANLELSSALHISATATALSFQDVTETQFPAERPENQGEARLIYTADSGIGGSLFLRHRGEAFSIGAEGERIRLPASQELDAELSYRFLAKDRSLDLFLRVENAFDADILPQLGLPAPGRTARGGLRLSL
ncbi:TonB-dependent receptor [Parvularcula sp. ZS-1/3]|uniref:TonB-dependent receptor n=1 Tax=Parvularcula mediterranea TaxID=2732508 RepID=A0A7Y3RMI2_9PROT|nr:TonB-dependent receptor [Parvularcula mediterranea]NNU16832.1 TonB-dependent receptor [Parvularcula mediterranea]